MSNKKTTRRSLEKRRESEDYYMEESSSEAEGENAQFAPIPLANMQDGKEGPIVQEETTKYERAGLSKAKLRDYISFATSGKGLTSSARITDDGRILVTLDLKRALPDLPKDYANPVREFAIDPTLTQHLEGIVEPPRVRDGGRIPKLCIVIMVVGSRGDVQPFIALGMELAKQGHRVRIASHEKFRTFVTEKNLEFYNIGGDPEELMSYMVRNPGLIPGMTSLRNGDIGRKRKMLGEILAGCWGACTQTDPSSSKPFVADAIISNPPAFAHIHCAEALGIPLQLSFTMPWCPTTAFPHPLVNISQSNAEAGLTNYLSYALAELMTWQGLGDVINTFRRKSLGLEPLSVRSGPGIVDRLKVPWTYCFSPSLVPKPIDWKNHIDVVGFYFLDLANDYKPPQDLAEFLAAGPPPIYIGFGSVVVQDPKKMTATIFEATAKAGVRALVSAGWGGLGGATIPSHVFILGNVPHDWLFTKVFAVCHHGGAGTTAIGLRLGRPTIVVPFFGDQPFWGSMIHKAGAGPKLIKKDELGVEVLRAAIEFCKSESVKAAAGRLAEKIQAHDGVKSGVDSFHRHLPLLNMRCDLLPERLAVWWSTRHCLRLSTFAAQILADQKLIDMNELELHRPKEYESKARATDPVTGGAIEIFRTITHYYGSIAQIFYSPVKGIINTTTAIPRGVVEIVGALSEGFHRLPEAYGSKTRKIGKIKGFSSGVQEGAKGVFWGYADAITGLVTEPMEGAKKEGFLGFIKGSGRSYINATVRPAAGIVGAIAHPITGAWMSVRKLGGARAAEVRVHQIRIEQGKDAVASADVSLEDKERVIEAFRRASRPDNEKDRRKTMEERIQSVMEQGGAGTVTLGDTFDANQDNTRASTSTGPHREENKPPLPPRPKEGTSKGDNVTQIVTSPLTLDEAYEAGHPILVGQRNAVNPIQQTGMAENRAANLSHQTADEQFETDLRMAIEASLRTQGS